MLFCVERLLESIILDPSVLHSNDPGFELVSFNFCAFYAFLALENEELNVVRVGWRASGILSLCIIESC